MRKQLTAHWSELQSAWTSLAAGAVGSSSNLAFTPSVAAPIFSEPLTGLVANGVWGPAAPGNRFLEASAPLRYPGTRRPPH